MRQVTGFTLHRVQADLQTAGALRRADPDRAFHNIYLESGNMPLSHLRRDFAHEGLLAL